MSLFDIIKETYPDLQIEDFYPFGAINLRDDSDGYGAYISKWEYSEPIPEGLTLGKTL